MMALLWALCVSTAARVNAELMAVFFFFKTFSRNSLQRVLLPGTFTLEETEVILRVLSQKSSLLCDVLARKAFSRGSHAFVVDAFVQYCPWLGLCSKTVKTLAHQPLWKLFPATFR